MKKRDKSNNRKIIIFFTLIGIVAVALLLIFVNGKNHFYYNEQIADYHQLETPLEEEGEEQYLSKEDLRSHTVTYISNNNKCSPQPAEVMRGDDSPSSVCQEDDYTAVRFTLISGLCDDFNSSTGVCFNIEDDITIKIEKDDKPSKWECGDEFYDNRDGSVYSTVQIGDQCWFKEDLRYDSGCTSNLLNEQSPFNACKSKKDEGSGFLYQWGAVMSTSSDKGNQGICPSGWKVPTDGEWNTLEKTLSNRSCDVNRDIHGGCYPVGMIIKSSSDWDGNNLSEFTALPTGSSHLAPISFGYWWSSSLSSNRHEGPYAWARKLESRSPEIYRVERPHFSGLAVRCLHSTKWPVYTVSYDTSEGSCYPQKQTVAPGGVTVEPLCINYGYEAVFEISKGQASVDKFTGIVSNVTSNSTIKVQWEKDPQECSSEKNTNCYTKIKGDVVWRDHSGAMWTETLPSLYYWNSKKQEKGPCVEGEAHFEACHACEGLNYAGYTDWELPSSEYLRNDFGASACGWPKQSGVGSCDNCSYCAPLWDTNAVPSNYWGSTLLGQSISFKNGFLSLGVLGDHALNVRCRRK